MEVFGKTYHPPGTSPGTLAAPEAGAGLPARLELIHYGPGTLVEQENPVPGECARYRKAGEVTWVHVCGPPDPSVLRGLGDAFGLHELALEDVLNVGQRPKAENYDDHLFVVLGLHRSRGGRVAAHQVSLFLGDGFVVSFCTSFDDPFESLRHRVRKEGSGLRRRGADYLFYGLADTIIDEGFPLLEEYGGRIEAIESELLEQPRRPTMEDIHALRRELLLLRQMLWPQREVVSKLLRVEEGLIGEGTVLYLRDCYDHSVQILDLLETYREMTAGMLEVYLSSVGNRTNETMRLLTVVATLFIPLTFIAGVYGMNFDRGAGPWNMPELGWPLGYPLVLLVMFVVGVVMLVVFRRRGWF